MTSLCRACRFPRYLQADDSEWRGRVRAQNGAYSLTFEFNGGIMTVTSRDEHATGYIRRCDREETGDGFVVRHEQEGDISYLCMKVSTGD